MTNNTRAPLLFDIGPQAESPYAKEVPISSTGVGPDAILVPTPGQNWWVGGWFVPSSEEAARSRGALQVYRANYEEWQKAAPSNMPWSWRLRPAGATGLPTYLRGHLDAPLQDGDPAEQARRWLESSQASEVLLGRPDWETFFSEAPQVTSFPPVSASDAKLPSRWESVHVHYRQLWRGQLPVLGAHLAVHMGRGDERVSASSSYLPLDPGRNFDPRSSIDPAVQARRVLAHYARIDPAAGISTKEDALARLEEWQVSASGATSGDDPQALQKSLAVLPFAGDFRIIYRVYLSEPDGFQSWGVLVDAETGAALGRPEPLHYHAFAYASSQNALAAAEGAGLNPPVVVAPELEQPINGDNPARDFMDVFIGTGAARQVPQWADGALPGPPTLAQFEANNVAIHAARAYLYLRDECGVGLANPAPWPPAAAQRIVAEVGVSGGGQLITFFRLPEQLITFQSDNVAQGTANIYTPARDPELIYHEVIHGLMWMLNSDPFGHTIITAPFARALVEGLANYLARSLGQRISGLSTANEHFALATYRTGEWKERWALFRASHLAGQDYLPWPNLYPGDMAVHIDPDPSGATAGIYDVGMICARALWMLRILAGRASVDHALIEAFWHFTRGWTSSFEALAEGMLERAERDGWVDLLIPVFGSRGVIAAQGIQALASAADGSVVAGTDAGLALRDPATGMWSMWSELSDGTQVTDVVDLTTRALAGGASMFYAATERTVFQRAPGDAHWSQVGPEVGLRPLCLAVNTTGDVFVGTGRDVRVARAANLTWSEIWRLNDLPGDPPPDDERLALDMAISGAGTPTATLCVAGMNAAWTRRPSGAGSGFLRGALQDQQTDMVMCVLAHANDATVFVGSGNVGVWRGALDGIGRLSGLQQIGTRAQLGDGAVLCLAEDSTGLYAGGSAGVFRNTPAGTPGSWQLLAGLPSSAAVTALALTTNAIYAGTALHGLWRFERTTQTWAKQTLPFASIASIPDAPVPAVLPVPAGILPTLNVFPYQHTQEGTISFVLGQPQRVELWRLEQGLVPVADDPNGSFTANNQPPGIYLLVIGRA